jgi:hypothetical protein
MLAGTEQTDTFNCESKFNLLLYLSLQRPGFISMQVHVGCMLHNVALRRRGAVSMGNEIRRLEAQ